MKMMRRALALTLSIIVSLQLRAQEAEKQKSFAQESKPHTYYVHQAEMWWKEVQKDSTSEYNWYNYFRACRNSQGTADWRTDFVNESPYLMQGEDILKRIKNNLPNTFTYYYLSYLNNGIGDENGENLLKAYSLNPKFEGIHSSVVSYAESSLNRKLRKRVNKDWYKTNYLSQQSLTYSYNVLMSLDSNSILFTQNDNDTYPAWMLQDALNIRPDVLIVNIDFLLLENYREDIFKALKLPMMDLGEIDQNEYHLNWQKVVSHILSQYKGKRSLYIGMTLFSELYENFKDKLIVSGLAFKYSDKNEDLAEYNCNLYENVFLLDYIGHHFYVDDNQQNVDYQNLNYLNFLKVVYDKYKLAKRRDDSIRVKKIAIDIANSTGNKEYIELVANEFS